uniref:Uncharacterized protein n=1 Tax=Anguilla anguilla TaxID=7936 RepID=A0A0E9SE63_ANGAN
MSILKDALLVVCPFSLTREANRTLSWFCLSAYIPDTYPFPMMNHCQFCLCVRVILMTQTFRQQYRTIKCFTECRGVMVVSWLVLHHWLPVS